MFTQYRINKLEQKIAALDARIKTLEDINPNWIGYTYYLLCYGNDLMKCRAKRALLKQKRIQLLRKTQVVYD